MNHINKERLKCIQMLIALALGRGDYECSFMFF